VIIPQLKLKLHHFLNGNHEGPVSVRYAEGSTTSSSTINFFIGCVELGSILMQDGWTALALAAYHGHTQIVHILLNAGASPDVQGQV
jgi:hypothetical protein